MRTSSTPASSVSMVLAQIAGWLAVGLIFWLLLLTHDVLAAPAAATSITTTEHLAPEADGPSFRLFGRRKPAMPRTEAGTRRRGCGHAHFWHARKATRRAFVTPRPVPGLLLPRRATHRGYYQQYGHTHYKRTHGKAGRRSMLGATLTRVIFGPASAQ